MDAISGQVPFRDKFRDFAVRNINETLSNPDPLETRYQKLDARFPELPPGGTKQRGKHRLEAREEKYEYFELTAALSAGYWRFDVTDTKIQQLVLDFSGLAPGDALAVDILLETRQDPPLAPLWERRKLPTGETSLCRTRSGEDFLDIYLILSNHDLDQRSVSGNFTIEALEEPCSGYGINFTYTGHGVSHPALGDDRADDISWMVTGEILPDESGEFDLVGTGTVSGTYWEATRFTSDGVEYCKRTDIHGTMILMGGIIGQELLITGIPDEDMMAAGWGWLGLSEEVPVEGGTVAGERKSGLHQLPRDDPLPMYTCPGMADVTTLLEVRPLSE